MRVRVRVMWLLKVGMHYGLPSQNFLFEMLVGVQLSLGLGLGLGSGERRMERCVLLPRSVL